MGNEHVRMWAETLDAIDRIRRPSAWIVEDDEPNRLAEIESLHKEVLREMLKQAKPVMGRAAHVLLEIPGRFPGKDVVETTRLVISGWARTLLNGSDPSAGEIARRFLTVVHGEDATPPNYWATTLGQLLFIRDGFPLRHAERIEARFVMGGISRQAVQQSASLPFSPAIGKRDGILYIERDVLYKAWHDSRRLRAENMMHKVKLNPLGVDNQVY